MRPRVLVVTTHFPRRERGDVTGNFVVDPVLALADDVDFRVVTPSDEGDGDRHLPLDGVPVHRFRYWFPRRAQAVAYRHGIPTNLREDWRARVQLPGFVLALLAAMLRHGRWADVVQAHWLPVAMLSLPLRWLFGVPIVVTLHGTDITQFPEWFTRFGLRRMDAIVTAHEDLRRDAQRLAPGVPCHQIRHLVEPQPVDADDERAVRDRLGDGPVGLFVARLSPERDPVTFVRAVPHALALAPDARFAVVGDGALRDEVERTVAELGLADRVHVFGYRRDVWTFLGIADAFAAISDRNNIWVTAMVEAMVAGVATVTTRAGDTAAELEDEVDTLLCDIGDAAQIGTALGRLLADEDLRRRIADGARARLEAAGFTPSDVTDATRTLYRTLAAAGR